MYLGFSELFTLSELALSTSYAQVGLTILATGSRGLLLGHSTKYTSTAVLAEIIGHLPLRASLGSGLSLSETSNLVIAGLKLRSKALTYGY